MRTTRQGFTLIEVSVAVLLLVMTFGGLITLLILGQESSITSKNDMIASSLAEEGVNLVRLVRAENIAANDPAFTGLYDDGAPADPYYFLITYDLGLTPTEAGVESSALMVLSENNMYGYGVGKATTVFRRLVTTQYHSDDGGYLDVTVEVYWKEGMKTNTVFVSGQLADWQ